jgi:hypothetical protein
LRFGSTLPFSLRSRGLICPSFFLDREAGVINRKLFQKKFDQKRRNGVINRKLFQKSLIKNNVTA